jgi:hypothetical protein
MAVSFIGGETGIPNDFTTDIEQGIDLLLNSVPLLDLTDIKLK